MKIRFRPSAKKATPKAVTKMQNTQPFIRQQGNVTVDESFFHALSSSSAPQLHTDEKAAELAGHFQAKAFTYNNHIFFNKNQYQPNTKEGKKLLAHELTHVKQNRSVIARDPLEDEKAKAAAEDAEAKVKAAEDKAKAD